MNNLTERRIEQVIHQAQLSLHVHERDQVYPEILELVDEMVDLLMEVRRDRAALAEIASRWDEAAACSRRGGPGADLALRMCGTARATLGLPIPLERPAQPAAPPLPMPG